MANPARRPPRRRLFAASRLPSPYVLAGAAALAVLVPATVLPAMRNETLRQERRYREQRMDGPPCAALPPPAAPAPGTKTFEIDAVLISREHGHVVCNEIRDRGGHGRPMPVCHLLAPGMVTVRTKRGSAAFDPGPGAHATIYAGRDGISCVRGAKPELLSTEHDRPYE